MNCKKIKIIRYTFVVVTVVLTIAMAIYHFHSEQPYLSQKRTDLAEYEPLNLTVVIPERIQKDNKPHIDDDIKELDGLEAMEVLNDPLPTEMEGMNNSAICNDSVVPNVVHWTWFHSQPSNFRFHNLISALSVLQKIEAKEIILWHNTLPIGQNWNVFLEQAIQYNTSLRLKKISPPESIFGNPLRLPEHKSDVVRISTLARYGGIYLDLDVVAVRSFDPLLCYETVLGKERHNGLCGGIILAAPRSQFMRMWLETYKQFDDSTWDANSVRMPMLLSKRYPGWIHIEETSMHRPNWFELRELYSKGSHFDWRGNYAIHLWYRKYKIEHNPQSIRSLNSTLGMLFRWIYYGTMGMMEGGEMDHSSWYL